MFKEYTKVETEKDENIESIDESLIDEQSVTEESFNSSEIKEVKVEVVKTGCVSGCFKLNVRKEPKSNAPVVGFLNKGVGVTIYTSFEDSDFYKVKTFSNNIIEGYCLKKYITTTY